MATQEDTTKGEDNELKERLLKLAEQGFVEWGGGKPKGLRGIVVRGELVSETIIRARR